MKIIWSIKDLVEIAKQRQENKFDANIVVSGARGNGKSTLLFKFFSRFPQFKPWINQVYSRKDVMALIEKSRQGCIFDDEAIRTGYKRNFYETDQKLLIQMLNMYRDNFNIYGLAVPNFYNLDKDLRDLIKIHLHVINRGLAVVHIPNEGNLYSDDLWDIKYNKKVEERWAKLKQKKPDFSPKYNRLTTFRGYLEFGDLTKHQRALYEEIKRTKRKRVYEEEMKGDTDREENFYGKLIERLKEGKITKETLLEICLVKGLAYTAINSVLNQKLRDSGSDKRLTHFLELGKRNLSHINFKGNKKSNGVRLKVI
jgi:hypothetical protein